jgi:DNA-binding phage protein
MLDVKALRHEMLDANCSMAELAKVCGISRSSMYRRFKGDAYFTLGEIFKCSIRLNLSDQRRNYIFFGES